MFVYNETKNNSDQKIEDVYNVDFVISYLAEIGILEYYYYQDKNEENGKYTYINDQEFVEGCGRRDDWYYINISKIEKIKTLGKGSKFNENKEPNERDVFILQKENENNSIIYSIKYFDKNGNCDNVGILELANPLIK